ncbi:error-prone DNA polymerase [Sphingomonas sp. CFBP 13603]|uniref:error-prone DNA polymerase n=1 Tax=Sphingomonas sp. CFBP 13603 TaxID=2774040 RepID=UPI001868C4C1|nr:error-prone DNA polymerase [Sphingomonas sp. CFBP 13603]MBE2993447.1 error-prone DNA polymerase [Sphingomonas sp. CFBP 13603]
MNGRAAPAFAELVAATNYSFLDGASHPSDIVGRAIELKLAGIGIADRNTVAGVVRAYDALERAKRGQLGANLPPFDFKLVVGARLVFADGTPDIVAYPATRAGWGRLTRLLTLGNRRAEKGGCILGFDDLLAHLGEILLIVMPECTARQAVAHKDFVLPVRNDASLEATLAALRPLARRSVWLGVTMPHGGRDRRRQTRLARIAVKARVPILATNDVRYAVADDRSLHDIVTCIREGTTIQRAGKRLGANGERHLKDADEIAHLYRDRPHAIAETAKLLARIDFTLDELKYEYPHEPVPAGWDPQGWLEHLVWESALDRYGERVPEKMLALLYEEFRLIRAREYAYYFLTVHDVVRYARSVEPPILCQGRGSAANSAVCFLLGVTSVDPMKYDLLFSRFVSAERDEPPDIDVDFEHERREEVMQYIYRRYGRDRAAIAATVIHYRPRSTVREVGKALGLTEDVTHRLTSTVWGSFSSRFGEQRLKETGFDPGNPEIARLHDMVDRLLQFPRHLSQHVGGFVLTQGRLDEMVPIHNGAMVDRTFIEWDKDDIDCLGLMKVDILALGMLTCIRKSFDLMRSHGLGDHDLDTIPDAAKPVYDMLCKGDSIGVFQVESRAQINMLPRLRPKELYDLVVQVAIVRPGPIEGDMVHPYLRRRAKKEKVEYPSPSPLHGPAGELRDVLEKTLGVPLFQEQAMKLAIVAAKFTPEEANQLRRAMATFRNVGKMENFQVKMVEGMVARGYEREFAERCFKQIEGFGSYGFPESHALSFARLVYVSSWIKCFHPAVFCCALLNSQPMGFYAPAQLVRDAVEHGVTVLPVDVNASGWDNSLSSPAPGGARDAGWRGASADVSLADVPVTDGELSTATLPGGASAAAPLHHPADGPPPRAGEDVRLGFRQVDGFRKDWADEIVRVRTTPFASIEELARRANLPQRAMNLLADADAFRSVAKERREALWDLRRTPPKQLALFAAAEVPELGQEPDAHLPAMPLSEQVAADYQTTRLSLKAHPMQFLRERFAAEGILSSAQANATKDGRRAKVAGVVLVRQRPGKGNAIFVTIEDETGITNGLMWARDFEANRRAVMASRLMVLEGVIQRSEEGVTHLMTSRVQDRSDMLRLLSEDQALEPPLARVDEVIRPVLPRGPDGRTPRAQHPRAQHPRDVRVLPKSRDFH